MSVSWDARTYAGRIGHLAQDALTEPLQEDSDSQQVAGDAIRLMMWHGVDRAIQVAQGYLATVPKKEESRWLAVIERLRMLCY